jgi:hypothetical protein
VVSDSKSSFNFGSAEDPPIQPDFAVPDGGLTVALLGGALVALYAFRRKMA